MSESTNQEELRKLDAEVAAKVFNLPEVEFRGEHPFYRNLQREKDLGGRWSTVVPAYSSSIEAAMEVVEKLRSVGVWTHIKIFHHTTQVFVEMGVPSSECQEWGSTAAEAICKCALKAYKKFEYLAEALKALAHTQER